jgi:hypothetical protein
VFDSYLHKAKQIGERLQAEHEAGLPVLGAEPGAPFVPVRRMRRGCNIRLRPITQVRLPEETKEELRVAAAVLGVGQGELAEIVVTAALLDRLWMRRNVEAYLDQERERMQVYPVAFWHSGQEQGKGRKAA